MADWIFWTVFTSSSFRTTPTQSPYLPSSMYITRSITQKLTIAATSNININFEADGTCCLTMPSLTGEGTHTKWYYLESVALRRKQGDAATVRSNTGDQQTSVDCPPVVFNGSLPSTSARKVKLELEAVHAVRHERDEWDSDAGSDTTELVDEEAERGAWLKVSREESLPDLPYERIMRRISQEPTLIEGEDISNGTGAQLIWI